jgi:hypothetical protein
VIVKSKNSKKNNEMSKNYNLFDNLPNGIHWVDYESFFTYFDTNSTRKRLLKGLKRAISSLRKAGCKEVYTGGSFITSKDFPDDFDGCWGIEGVNPELLDPVLLDFTNGRAAQKAKYGGELFPAEGIELGSGKTWLEFFQQDRNGKPKGIVGIRLRKPREKI